VKVSTTDTETAVTDVEKVASVLQARYGDVEVQGQYGWPTAAQNVIDCVLSLNRHYAKVVEPRVRKFALANPQVSTLVQLRACIKKFGSATLFCESQLSYRDDQRAQVLEGVVDYLLDAIVEIQGDDEGGKLHEWARCSRPGDYLTVGVHGFGLAGFQYLRMLFGAQTAKPDVHIVRFVEEITSKRSSPVQALNLMERAAKLVNRPLREVDAAIWRERSTR
jgi:hypothetical protein